MIDDTQEDFDTYIELSMVEIYNENIRDLLSEDFPACPTGGLKLLENEKERVTVDRVTLKRPESADEVMALVLLGNQRRSTSFTESNSVSSRSHAVLQINVGRNSKGHEVDFEQAVVRQCTSSATLSIIDLAGSERASATRNMGARMKEGANINKSLLALSSCISALCQRPIGGRKPHVPYRNSKLTRMLKFSLGGNCRTVMIVCVSPSSKDIEDTHNTLVWADKAKNVSTKITRNTAGVQVSVQQYLTTISQQEARIKYLESKIEEGTLALSAYAKKKLQAARQDAKAVLDHLRSEFESAIPFIVEGAKRRAEWDQAEMRAAAMKGRIVELETGEDTYGERARLDQLVEVIDKRFAGSPQLQTLVQQEAAKTKSLENLYKTSSARSFGHAFEPPEEEAFKLQIRVMELELNAAVSSSREKGYREGAQRHAAHYLQMASILVQVTSTLTSQTDALQTARSDGGLDSIDGVIEQLQALQTSISSASATLFAQHQEPPALSLPPNPVPKRVALPQPRMSTLGQASRRRLSTAPTAPLRSALRPNRLSLAPPGTPRRASLASRLASPAKLSSRPFKVGQIKSRTPKKAFRWKDEAGEGDLGDVKTLTSPDTEDTVPGGSGSSDEWKDEPDDRESTASPEQPIVTRPAVTPMGPPIPAWKKSKLGLSKLGTLTALDEAREESSSPEPQPTKMGPPARSTRPPLNARHHVPALTSPTTSSFSNLLRPTIASRSRSSINIRAQAELDAKPGLGSPARRVVSNGRMQPPSSVSKAKRRSSKGPYGVGGRPKSKGAEASLIMSTSGLPTSLGTGSRIDGIPGISITDENRQSSMMPTASWSMRSLSGPGPGGPAGPRASLAVPSLPRPSLASKPSLSRLNTSSSSNLNGDRAVWR